jgi:uncharacterized DUF497 family protein
VQFEWDPGKATRNERVHHVSYEEASSVFGDPLAITVEDAEHSTVEPRFQTAGLSYRGRMLIVWHAERDEMVRIIGAREATPRERRMYESRE